MKELCEKDNNVESVTALGSEWNLSSDNLKLCRGFAGKEHTIITHNHPQYVAKQYLDWLQEIPALKELSIDRHYGWQPGTNVQLHVFADASEKGLCVVAYLRFEKDYKVRGFFVMGKTRVAPIKTATIRELELQAALHA